MSSSIRRTTAASLLVLSAGLALSVPAGAAPTSSAHLSPATSPTAAQAGAGWVGRQFKGRAFLRSKGKPETSETVQAVLALAAAGVGQTQAQAAMTWLESNFGSYVSSGGVDNPGALAYVILAAQALGVDPTTFGGTAPANNLVARLEATQQTSGADAGLFGSSADATYTGAFDQGLSLMALANQGIANSTTAAGVAWLKNQQCSDGGWEAYRSATGPDNPCAAPDPATFSGPDTNSSSLAVEGLVASGASFDVSPTSFFESAQNADGGFGYIGASSQSPDPDSTGEVIQALVALGQLGNAAFTQSGGGTPLSALESFQLGCAAAKAHRGAFSYPPAKGPNLLATVQAVPGAAEVAFPLTAQTLSSSLPRMTCPRH
jgi:hypothetical protein